MKILYITHCSRKKDDTLKNTGKKITPDKMYTATYLQRFIKRCKERKVKWTILSDKHDVVFSSDKIEWYNLSPDKVMKNERSKEELLQKAYLKLKKFDKVFFYYNPGRFHRLYRYLVDQLMLRKINIKLITHLSDIT